jgi:hypothetical protein
VSVNVGTLNGTKRGFFAANNNTTPDKVFVDPDGNIAVFTPTSVTNAWPDADLPAPNSVDFLDGYLVFTIGDGRAFATDLNSTSVNALSFGKAEAKPDGLVRVVSWGGRLLFFGKTRRKSGRMRALRRFRSRATLSFRGGLAAPIACRVMRTDLPEGRYSLATIAAFTSWMVTPRPRFPRLISMG